MTGFLYATFLRLLYPTSIAGVFLLAAVIFRRRRAVSTMCLILGLGVIAVSGNGWVVQAMVRSLEWAHLPPDPVPHADAILVLSGGIHARSAPRPTVEVSEAGDRVLYGAELFRRGHAPLVINTGDVGPGTIGRRPEAEDMADLMVMVGVPRSAIVLETRAQNTHDHAVNLCPMFAERQIRRVLLVTSAIHMRRSLGVFRHSCPGVEYVPAPTDFRVVQRTPSPWYRMLAGFIPTPYNMADFTDASHEYLGMVYYRLRGWL